MPENKRILITGSRGWTALDDMYNTLKSTYLMYKPNKVVLVSGHAVGADKMAEQLWAKHVNADWIETHPASDYPHPLKRNDAMVELGADICLAFVVPCEKKECQSTNREFHYSHGAMYTYNKALEAGIESHLVYDSSIPPF